MTAESRMGSNSEQVVALPRISSTSQWGMRAEGLRPAVAASRSELESAAAWAHAARAAVTNDDPDDESESSEDEGFGLRPAVVASKSKISKAAAWARAAHLAVTKDGSDDDSESSDDEVEVRLGIRPALAPLGSQPVLPAAKALSAFDLATQGAPDAETGPPRGEEGPGLSVQNVSTATSSAEGTGTHAKVPAKPCIKQMAVSSRKSVRFVPSDDCKGSEIATPATVVASSSFLSESGAEGHALQEELERSEASRKVITDRHGRQFQVLGKPSP
eukprot:TRINITY_DN9746_c0_g2_i1.p1 TRINITY_DN9746_c0_g2~~TRINITY_DN9746_c0_g2_i1.p1  ORF type:complete len:274 (+),score=48.91 TRINITY_DN9746_c0_g2_i1:137-958(+)